MSDGMMPKKPSMKQEIDAIVWDALGRPRPAGAMTLREWKQEVCVYWFERMVDLMRKEEQR